MTVWIVGQFKEAHVFGIDWEFQGVFSTEEKAIDACKEPHWFVAPATLDTELPAERGDWPGLYYPAGMDNEGESE